ncbi:MAG: AAA family ATPase [Spirochaetia bacterium]|nr:AAA family ATPase [Spirochaetia bacterium]
MADLHFDITTLTPEEASFSYKSTRIEQCKASSFHGEIIGQPRAVQALEMGLSIPGKGYNIFVSGEPGTGRMTAIRMILKKQALTGTLQDILYVNNFSRPEFPVLILLPAGKGLEFQQALKGLVHRIKEELIKQLEDTTDSSEKKSKIDINPDLLIQKLKKDFQKIRDHFSDKVIINYLKGVQEDLNEYSFIFSGADADTIRSAQFFLRYSVNLLVDRSGTAAAPMIYENHPTFSTLFGSIDDKADNRDDNYPPFLSIHGGSFLEASGGYLILNMVDILKEEGLWDHIKRSIRTGLVIMQNSSGSNQRSPGGIRPEPIPIDLKIIALGNEELYDYLFVEDEDFYKLFKINAEFDFSMPATDENIGNYIGFIKMIVDDEQLSPIETSGIAEIVRYGSYLVEQRDELSTQFSLIADILRESHYWAKTLSSETITGEIIKHTLKERDYLANLPESKIIDQILSGEMLLHLEGSRLGNVNALAVLDRGTYSFGIPAVISATVAPGTEGIVNIEHEAGLSGEIHDKGLLILEGYLRKMYARNFPLSIYSGICFEQSYAEVDGDSASSSELYALLSSIGNIPIRQDIAVTGSVNQMGEIQPVGGINEKITGFFSICSRKGLTGKQGVIIPKLNIRNLILPEFVIDAIKKKKFSIYPVSNIDEGMQVLASRPAGIRNAKGVFPPNTMNRIIEDKLKRLYEISRQQN